MEKHLLIPFIPDNIKILMLGSFPPTPDKWQMEFYYPNFQNDMWRIFGLVFFNDKEHLLDETKKKFDKTRIQEMLRMLKIGVGDAATIVNRLKGNASDKFLEIIDVLNFKEILTKHPSCEVLVSTGEKSAMIIQEYFELSFLPKIGEKLQFEFEDRIMNFYRVPSSSRAYPKSIEKKAIIYQKVFKQILD